MFGDEHIDAFLIGPHKTPGVSICAWLFNGSDTEMMDAEAGGGDKKSTQKDAGEKGSGRARRGRAMIDAVSRRETKIRPRVHISGNRFNSEKYPDSLGSRRERGSALHIHAAQFKSPSTLAGTLIRCGTCVAALQKTVNNWGRQAKETL